ncbi:tyrosine kinase receptor Cad96Ca-like [Mycteria americana]|uniref:tyrosine kinase receptor Cad96Ca-like n=1 Tax=Mycteria americana TaxID=33587 RepID=UPI003F586DAB
MMRIKGVASRSLSEGFGCFQKHSVQPHCVGFEFPHFLHLRLAEHAVLATSRRMIHPTYLQRNVKTLLSESLTCQSSSVSGTFKMNIFTMSKLTDKKVHVKLGFLAAPEVRNDGLYSRASDVFSFGIMIWEALTAQLTNLHMSKPLKPFCSLNSREVLKFTELGSIPGDCGFPNLARLIGFMKACWNHNPPQETCIFCQIRDDQTGKAVRESEAARSAAVSSLC